VQSPKPADVVGTLLQYFRANPHRSFSRDELAEAVWGIKHFPASRTIDMTVCCARKRLKRGERIVAVHGYGYRYER